MNHKAETYFQKQPEIRREILYQLRTLIMDTFPGIEEDFMYGVPVYDKGRFYLVNLKNQVNLGVSIVGLSPEEIAHFEGGGKTARHIKIHQLLDDDQKKKLVPLLELVKEKAGIPE